MGEGNVCMLFWGVFAYTLLSDIQTHKLISAEIFAILRVIFTRRFFSFRLFALADISWQLTRKHFSLRDYRATMSAYALAHFTYRNSKPPFSNDRWPSRRILFQGNKDTVTFFLSFNRLAGKRDRSIDFP